MFLGTHFPKLDEKGRLILPAKFRDQFADGLVITRGHDRCLAVYPPAAFEALVAKFNQVPSTVREVRNYQRMLAAGASAELPDRQGRITIPPILRTYAGLDRDVVVTGAVDRAEIWDQQVWDGYSESQEIGFSDMDMEFTPPAG